MKISIVIPNYNGEKLLQKNLPKVIEAAEFYGQKSNDGAEIIVVDDCSTDKSVSYIKNQILKINPPAGGQKSKMIFSMIENPKNLGFASTVNKGVKEANGEIVVLLNTDVVPQMDFLIPLIPHFEDEKTFAVGCMDKSIENGKVVLRGRGIGKWEKGFLVHSRGEVDKTSTLWVSGGSGAFRKSIWEKLEGFNKLYNPFYWEDIDLSYRAIKSGYKIWFEPKSIVIHEHKKGAIKSKYNDEQIKTIAYRNQILFVWINATDLNLQFLHLLWLPYHILKACLNRDWEFLKAFIKACVLFPKAIGASFKAQKLFIKSDKEVIENLAL